MTYNLGWREYSTSFSAEFVDILGGFIEPRTTLSVSRPGGIRSNAPNAESLDAETRETARQHAALAPSAALLTPIN